MKGTDVLSRQLSNLIYFGSSNIKIVFVLFALVNITFTDYHGMQQVTLSHVPYYKLDWQVKDDKYFIDYGQIEAPEHDNTNWWVALPGYSHIKRNDVVNAQAQHFYSQSYKSNPVYKTDLKTIQYKEEYNPVYNSGYTPVQYKGAYKPIYETDHKPAQFGEESIKPVYKTEYKPVQYKEESIQTLYMPIQFKEEYKPFYDNEGYEAEEKTRN